MNLVSIAAGKKTGDLVIDRTGSMIGEKDCLGDMRSAHSEVYSAVGPECDSYLSPGRDAPRSRHGLRSQRGFPHGKAVPKRYQDQCILHIADGVRGSRDDMTLEVH